MQFSLFTSAERIARAWLKSHGLQFHLCALEKNLSSGCRTCLTCCCSRTCHSPRAHHLPHSLFLVPLQKNTQHNRFNMFTSKNTQYIMNISKLSQSTSRAIKNHSGVITCRVAETRARQLQHIRQSESLKKKLPEFFPWETPGGSWVIEKAEKPQLRQTAKEVAERETKARLQTKQKAGVKTTAEAENGAWTNSQFSERRLQTACRMNSL